jgi:hypothetical protein
MVPTEKGRAYYFPPTLSPRHDGRLDSAPVLFYRTSLTSKVGRLAQLVEQVTLKPRGCRWKKKEKSIYPNVPNG